MFHRTSRQATSVACFNLAKVLLLSRCVSKIEAPWTEGHCKLPFQSRRLSLNFTDSCRESTIRLLGRMTDSEHDFLLSTLQDSHSELQCVHDDGKWHLLSHYTHVLGEQMPVNDLEYLIQKKALSLPCSHIRDELFANFLRYVYPLTPFLDIDDFYTRNLDGESMRPGDGSLLLTQAILYAGSQFTDLSTFQELGFDSRREACQHFRENVRVGKHDPMCPA